MPATKVPTKSLSDLLYAEERPPMEKQLLDDPRGWWSSAREVGKGLVDLLAGTSSSDPIGLGPNPMGAIPPRAAIFLGKNSPLYSKLIAEGRKLWNPYQEEMMAVYPTTKWRGMGQSDIFRDLTNDLKTVNTKKINTYADLKGGLGGTFNPINEEIQVSKDVADWNTFIDSLAHELNHLTSKQAGWQYGASSGSVKPTNFEKMMETQIDNILMPLRRYESKLDKRLMSGDIDAGHVSMEVANKRRELDALREQFLSPRSQYERTPGEIIARAGSKYDDIPTKGEIEFDQPLEMWRHASGYYGARPDNPFLALEDVVYNKLEPAKQFLKELEKTYGPPEGGTSAFFDRIMGRKQ